MPLGCLTAECGCGESFMVRVIAVPLTSSRMNFGYSPETSTRMDAGEEPPWMGLRRVSGEYPKFMSRKLGNCYTVNTARL